MVTDTIEFTGVPKNKWSIEDLQATITFNGASVTVGGDQALLCWHLAVEGVLTPFNNAQVIPPHLRARDGRQLQMAANSLRNNMAWRNADKAGTNSNPLTLAYINSGDEADGVRFVPGVKVVFRA